MSRDVGPRSSASPGVGVEARRRALAILVGGAVGTGLRAAVAALVPVGAGGWPWATFLVNLSGALALGFLMARWQRTGRSRSLAVPLVGVGLIGSFTTFSAFAVEVVALAPVAPSTAAAYAVVSPVAGVVLAALGRRVAVGVAW